MGSAVGKAMLCETNSHRRNFKQVNEADSIVSW